MLKEKFAEVNWTPEIADRRKFGLLLLAMGPVGATVLTLVLRLFTGEWHFIFPLIIWGVTFVFGLNSFVLPKYSLWCYRAWFALVTTIDFIVTYLGLTLFFFAVMLPAALIMRLRGYKPFSKGPEPGAETYWVDCEKDIDPKRYLKQF